MPMNPIIQILKDHHVNDQKITELFQALTQNPLAAMTLIQGLGIAQDKLQLLMMTVMGNPGLIKEAVEELNLDFSKVEAAKAKLEVSK